MYSWFLWAETHQFYSWSRGRPFKRHSCYSFSTTVHFFSERLVSRLNSVPVDTDSLDSFKCQTDLTAYFCFSILLFIIIVIIITVLLLDPYILLYHVAHRQMAIIWVTLCWLTVLFRCFHYFSITQIVILCANNDDDDDDDTQATGSKFLFSAAVQIIWCMKFNAERPFLVSRNTNISERISVSVGLNVTSMPFAEFITLSQTYDTINDTVSILFC